MKVFEYKLRPTKEQVRTFEQMLWDTKCLYNQALREKIDYYEKTGKYLNLFTQGKSYNKKTWPTLPAVVVDTVLARCDKSFMNFFRGLRSGRKVGFPKFKSIKFWKSFEFRDYQQAKIRDEKWIVTKNNQVSLIFHRQFEGTPKFTRLVKKSDGYYVQLLCDSENKKQVKIKKACGVDMGLKYFLADSDGEKVAPPQFFRKSQWKLGHMQRKLSGMKEGGSSWKKQSKLIAKLHKKIADQRKDWIHKLSHGYAEKYDAVFIEDLNVDGMGRDRHLSKSIHDAAWAKFFNNATYKLQERGKWIFKVKPHYTSQKCSECGAIVQKTLSQRTHICPECSYVGDRDENAARNIFKIGLVQAFAESAPLGETLKQEALKSQFTILNRVRGRLTNQ